MGTLNWTTEIPVVRTVAEIQAMLGLSGASAIMVRYADRQPVAVSFSLAGPHGDRAFTLPVDTTGMGKVLAQQLDAGEIRSRGGRLSRTRLLSAEHAGCVAWRVVKDWLAAQLALVDARMASLDQVMLPYLHVDGEVTLYEAYRRNEQAAIEAGR